MIIRQNDTVEKQEVLTEGARGASIRWLVGKDSPAPNFYLRQLELEPGGHTPFHSHPWEHEIFVLEGVAHLKTGANSYQDLHQGSFALIMPGEEHQFINIGDTPFKFLCVIPQNGA